MIWGGKSAKKTQKIDKANSNMRLILGRKFLEINGGWFRPYWKNEDMIWGSNFGELFKKRNFVKKGHFQQWKKIKGSSKSWKMGQINLKN